MLRWLFADLLTTWPLVSLGRGPDNLSIIALWRFDKTHPDNLFRPFEDESEESDDDFVEDDDFYETHSEKCIHYSDLRLSINFDLQGDDQVLNQFDLLLDSSICSRQAFSLTILSN
jgi:hypothetical protein